MNAAEYLQAVSGGSTVPLRVSLLPEASWDPQLKAEMVANGFAAFEEAALDRRVDDVTLSDVGNPMDATDTARADGRWSLYPSWCPRRLPTPTRTDYP